jgi:hypothetical protein
MRFIEEDFSRGIASHLLDAKGLSPSVNRGRSPTSKEDTLVPFGHRHHRLGNRFQTLFGDRRQASWA